jgi:hypothetical protein
MEHTSTICNNIDMPKHLNEMSAPNAMEHSSQPINILKIQKMEMRQIGFTISITRNGSSNGL